MTLDYYNENAIAYSRETLQVEFKERRNMLLKYLKPGAHILDPGCGAGRDSKAFIGEGYQVTAMDGSKKLCDIASGYIGQEVICERFQDLNQIETYDGVWACASLVHVPSIDLPELELIESELTNDVRANRKKEQWLNFIIMRSKKKK